MKTLKDTFKSLQDSDERKTLSITFLIEVSLQLSCAQVLC